MRLRPGVPVLHLGDGVVQIGLRHPLVFDGLERTEASFLASLEGRSAPVSADERRDFPHLVSALERNSSALALDVHSDNHLARATVRWRGCGPVSLEAARTLALAGVGVMSALDPRVVSPTDPYAPSSRGLTRSEAFARAIGETGADVRWTSREAAADIEVLCAYGAIDMAVPRELLARDVPHLLIVSDEDGLSVGPVVIPGSTACAGCVGLARADGDRRWPRIALQLGNAARDAARHLPAECSALAGAIAAREVLAALRGAWREAGQWWIPARGETSWRAVAPHDACGCGAARDPGDASAAEHARMPAGSPRGRPQERLGSSATI
jgi:hypothetical protein